MLVFGFLQSILSYLDVFLYLNDQFTVKGYRKKQKILAYSNGNR